MQDTIKKYQALIGDNPLFTLLTQKNINSKSKTKVHAESPDTTSVKPFVFRSTPGYITGTLRDYQLSGINWLIHMHSKSINCILADEMGLGKTLQTITFLGYLKECASINKPHLLIVPKSTLQNWKNEFNKFYPSYRVHIFHSSKENLKYNKKKLKRRQFDVVVTTYEMCIMSRTLNCLLYCYVIIDEAHRIKNENSKLAMFVRNYRVDHRMLITGTPLQNNLRELWALLNFLIPELFDDPEIFEEWLENKEGVREKKVQGRPKKRRICVIEDSEDKESTQENSNDKENSSDDVSNDQENSNDDDSINDEESSNDDDSINDEGSNEKEISNDDGTKNVHGNIKDQCSKNLEEEDEIDLEELREEELNDEDISKKKNSGSNAKPDTNTSNPKFIPSSNNTTEEIKINSLRQVILPFFLRREKIDVETELLPKKIINLYPPLTEMQKLWYRTILRKDVVGDNIQDKAALMNVVCQLRKVCNHPYLFDGAEPEPFTTDEHLVHNAGKMVILDELLKIFKEQGSKVLIFSQMSRMLDILEDYCLLREYEYRRLDGSTTFEDRNQGIEDFNNDNTVYIYLLTTRAGGLGINLTAADVVIIYDSDWNPQMDLQAMDRAHRIGQKKEVKVFRFVCENTIEEKIIERCLYKLKLDECLIRAKKQDKMDKTDLLGIIATGIDTLDEKTSNTPLDINEILKEGEKRTLQLNEKINGANLTESTTLDLYKFEGEDYKKISRKLEEYTERENNMSRRARSRKMIRFYDFQFCPTELRKILVMECDRDLSPEEMVKKESLMKEVFHFDSSNFYQYLRYCEMFGRDIDEIIKKLFYSQSSDKKEDSDIETDLSQQWNESEVRRYHEVFWKRYKEVSEIEKSLVLIEKAETKRQRALLVKNILAQKFKDINVDKIINNEDEITLALKDLKITYSQNTRSKYYSDMVDKILLLLYYLYHDIKTVWLFVKKIPWLRSDYFIRSRDNHDIAKRLKTLMDLILKNDMSKSEKTENSKDDE